VLGHPRASAVSDTLVCEHWLARNYRGDYARLDELVPSADWASSGFVPRPSTLEEPFTVSHAAHAARQAL